MEYNGSQVRVAPPERQQKYYKGDIIMKKAISILLILVMLLGFVVPAGAAPPQADVIAPRSSFIQFFHINGQTSWTFNAQLRTNWVGGAMDANGNPIRQETNDRRMVSIVQGALNRISVSGHQFLTVDGFWGVNTNREIRRYQNAHTNLSPADGVVGTNTWNQLFIGVNGRQINYWIPPPG